MGVTLMWNSFTSRGEDNEPGGKINFNSFEARDWLSVFRGKMESLLTQLNPHSARLYYAAHAGGGDTFDFKTNGLNSDATDEERAEYVLRGSQLSDGVFVSARDVGNWAAGAAARMTSQNKMDFMITAGAFQLSGNSKYEMIFNLKHWQAEARVTGYPAYGEDRESNFFQRMGYENITTTQQMNKSYLRIWGRPQ